MWASAMESSLPASSPRWRTLTLVASGIAVLELLVIVVAGIALLSKPISEGVRRAATTKAQQQQQPAARPARRARAARPQLSRAETSVLVLNGNGRSGAAADAAARLRGRGYVVGGVGNARRSNYTSSVVMYRRGYRPEAVRLARDLNIRIVGPLDGLSRSDLLGAHVALVVGN